MQRVMFLVPNPISMPCPQAVRIITLSTPRMRRVMTVGVLISILRAGLLLYLRGIFRGLLCRLSRAVWCGITFVDLTLYEFVPAFHDARSASLRGDARADTAAPSPLLLWRRPSAGTPPPTFFPGASPALLDPADKRLPTASPRTPSHPLGDCEARSSASGGPFGLYPLPRATNPLAT